MTCKFRFLIVFGLLGSGFGMAAPSAAALDQLAREVRTLLENHCVQCHGPSQQLNGLRLDSREGALEGGYSGPSLLLGDAGGSSLIRRLTSDDPTARMPLALPPLHPDQIDVLTRWIDQGAPWPRDAMARTDPESVPPQQDRHWSFLPIVRTEPQTDPAGPRDRSPHRLVHPKPPGSGRAGPFPHCLQGDPHPKGQSGPDRPAARRRGSGGLPGG